jgi:hypothetical protein
MRLFCLMDNSNCLMIQYLKFMMYLIDDICKIDEDNYLIIINEIIMIRYNNN